MRRSVPVQDGRQPDQPRRLAVAGQQEWDALVERHVQSVWDAARGFGLDAGQAAEVCQVAWLRLADHLDALPADADVARWLCAVVGVEARRVTGTALLDSSL